MLLKIAVDVLNDVNNFDLIWILHTNNEWMFTYDWVENDMWWLAEDIKDEFWIE